MAKTTTKKTKIIWRLANRPDPKEITDLVMAGILTKDEAREILITLETEEDRSKKSLQDEIKFLRELVAKLSTNRSVIIETIREVQKPYKQFDWYQPYHLYAAGGGGGGAGIAYLTSTSGTTSGSSTLSINASSGELASASTQDFTDIKTF